MVSEYLQVNGLNKYQHYKDRNMVWFKWHVDALQDYKFSRLSDSQKWLFIGLISLACKCENKIPKDYEWIRKQISNSKSISKDIDNLIAIDLLACLSGDASPIREEKSIEEKSIKEYRRVEYRAFEEALLQQWNSFCDAHPSLVKIKEITESRREHLKARFEKESFRDFATILEKIVEQPFLITGNPESKEHKDWKVSFDWLISNDTNYIKVLEGKYIKKEVNHYA